MLQKINGINPDQRSIQRVVDILEQGGIVIYPTDSVYGLGCDPTNKQGVEKLIKVAGIDPAKKPLTFVCNSLSMAAAYAKQIPNEYFRMIKDNTPGPYTFIMEATKHLPKVLQGKKTTFGFRIPDNPIALRIIESLGKPILSTSLKTFEMEESQYYIDPEQIYSDYGFIVDLIIDGGPGYQEETTVIDLTGNEPVVIREGKGIDDVTI